MILSDVSYFIYAFYLYGLGSVSNTCTVGGLSETTCRAVLELLQFGGGGKFKNSPRNRLGHLEDKTLWGLYCNNFMLPVMIF